jgi:hypothetical protein
MSVVRLNSPARPVARPAARPAVGLRTVTASRGKAKSAKVAKIIIIGIATIQILKLILDITVSQSAYELKSLKLEKIALTTQSEIIGQQVDSLSSQQNLANSAASLGMIANANPVFLRLEDQKVFGKPKEALNSDGRVARNNIADAALVQRSVLTNSESSKTATTINPDVAQSTKVNQPVAFSSGSIPASPTH